MEQVPCSSCPLWQYSTLLTGSKGTILLVLTVSIITWGMIPVLSILLLIQQSKTVLLIIMPLFPIVRVLLFSVSIITWGMIPVLSILLLIQQSKTVLLIIMPLFPIDRKSVVQAEMNHHHAD